MIKTTLSCVGLSISLMLLSLTALSSPEQGTTNNPAVINVEVATVQQQTLPDYLTALGNLIPSQSVQLSFSAAGHITQEFYKSGDKVAQGAVIAQLDDASEQAKLESLQAQLALQEADYHRYLALQQTGAVARATLDKVRADLQAARAQVKNQQVVINDKKLKAPFAGVLGDFQLTRGAFINAGQPLVQLVATDPLKVKYAVSQTHAASIKLQQRVSVTSEVFPQQTFIGSVIFISPTVDANTGTIAIQAQIANQQHQLSPGMFVRIKQFLGSNRSSLVIPANALVASQQGTKVFKVVAGEAKEIPVQVGLRQQGLVEITKGLALGDQVVISGVQKLTDGSLVKIIKYHSPDVSSGLANQQISLDQQMEHFMLLQPKLQANPWAPYRYPLPNLPLLQQPAADKNAASHDNHN